MKSIFSYIADKKKQFGKSLELPRTEKLRHKLTTI